MDNIISIMTRTLTPEDDEIFTVVDECYKTKEILGMAHKNAFYRLKSNVKSDL